MVVWSLLAMLALLVWGYRCGRGNTRELAEARAALRGCLAAADGPIGRPGNGSRVIPPAWSATAERGEPERPAQLA